MPCEEFRTPWPTACWRKKDQEPTLLDVPSSQWFLTSFGGIFMHCPYLPKRVLPGNFGCHTAIESKLSLCKKIRPLLTYCGTSSLPRAAVGQRFRFASVSWGQGCWSLSESFLHPCRVRLKKQTAQVGPKTYPDKYKINKYEDILKKAHDLDRNEQVNIFWYRSSCWPLDGIEHDCPPIFVLTLPRTWLWPDIWVTWPANAWHSWSAKNDRCDCRSIVCPRQTAATGRLFSSSAGLESGGNYHCSAII